MVNQRISVKDIIISVGGNIIGGAESFTLTVAADNEAAFEAGSYYAVEIVDGKKNVSGSIVRAFLDSETLNTIFPPDAGVWPDFTLTGTVVSGKTPGRTITVLGAKFDGFDIASLELDGYAKNTMNFKALNWKLS